MKDLNIFRLLVATDETSRVHGGVMVSVAGANVFSVPPIIYHGTALQ